MPFTTTHIPSKPIAPIFNEHREFTPKKGNAAKSSMLGENAAANSQN